MLFDAVDILNKQTECFENDFLKGLKVVIVDDNASNIHLLTEAIAGLQLEIATFVSPKKAVEIIERERFDLFLLDVKMPGMSGFDLAQVVRASKLNHNAAIMFISALCDPDNKIKGYNLGSSAYIEKPFNPMVVRSQIFNTLKTKILQDELANQQDTFLAMITHDLKTPVNAEINALKFLLGNPDAIDDSHREVMDDMLGAAKYMKNLVENVLIKYKFKNNVVILNKSYYCLKQLISECIEEMKYLFIQKNQTCMLNCKVKNPDVNIDYIEIKRVLHNLLINACEHGPMGSKIEIMINSSSENVALSVKNQCKYAVDSSIIFTPQYSQSQMKANTGLGLHIAKEIVEAHGGEISAKSDKDSVTLSFTLPK